MPYCFVTVKAGLILDDLTNVSDAMSPLMVVKLAVVGTFQSVALCTCEAYHPGGLYAFSRAIDSIFL